MKISDLEIDYLNSLVSRYDAMYEDICTHNMNIWEKLSKFTALRIWTHTNHDGYPVPRPHSFNPNNFHVSVNPTTHRLQISYTFLDSFIEDDYEVLYIDESLLDADPVELENYMFYKGKLTRKDYIAQNIAAEVEQRKVNALRQHREEYERIMREVVKYNDSELLTCDSCGGSKIQLKD